MLKKSILAMCSGALAVAVGTTAVAGAGAQGQKMAMRKALLEKTAYDFGFTSIDGTSLPLSAYKGKVILVVNTASKCGFTKQYEGLQNLWTEKKSAGLVILGVPSNDFFKQEPGTEAEIKKFCSLNYGVTFPMTSKVKVVGDGADPFYVWSSASLGKSGTPGWNFHKILIGKDGKAIAGFGSKVTPDDKALRTAIEAALKAPAPKT
jgi:glutathione peroxidase